MLRYTKSNEVTVAAQLWGKYENMSEMIGKLQLQNSNKICQRRTPCT